MSMCTYPLNFYHILDDKPGIEFFFYFCADLNNSLRFRRYMGTK